MVQKTELVRKFYAALSKGDFETVSFLLADNLVWHQPGHGALSGIYSGKEAVFAHLGKMAALSNGTFAIDEVDYITENENFVVAAIGFAVAAGEHSMAMKGVDLFRFEGELIQEVWLFSEKIDEEDRFWTALAKM